MDVEAEGGADARRRPYSCNGLHAMRCRLRSTGDAGESFCQFGFAANVIYGAASSQSSVSAATRLSAGAGGAFFSQRRAEGIAPLRGFASFSGLFFADGAGALVRATICLAYRVKPLAAFFVCALTAR